jgi:2-oxoglutarate ferredoxin oxidoreductase subunit alpha
VRAHEFLLEGAELVVVGFGTAGRVAQSAVAAARQQGLKAGLLRPISLNPFPAARLAQLATHARAFLVVEMNAGQMLDDVRLAVGGRAPVEFYGRMGGVVPLPDEILDAIAGLERAAARRRVSVYIGPLLNHQRSIAPAAVGGKGNNGEGRAI